MKNSKEYSQKVYKLYRSLKRKHPKAKKVIYDEPVDALIYAIISERMSEKAAHSAMKKFTDYFFDWNDLRVSRPEEIVELLRGDTAVIRDITLSLTKVLGAVFEKYNLVSLKALRKIGKRPARQTLEKMNGLSRFVVSYCMLTSLQGHAIPLTKKMIDYLKSEQLIHPDSDEQQIEGFLARQISAENAYEFYTLLRRQSEVRRAKTKKVKSKRAEKDGKKK